MALALSFTLAAAPAMAQLGGGGIGGFAAGKAPKPLPVTPDTAPPALPGAAIPAPAAGPNLAKPQGGDPTADLFKAIIKGDDSAAQSAIGRGADIAAQDQFGETPLQLAIALNRTSITFLLLQTRNELAAQGRAPEPLGAPWLLNAPSPPVAPAKAYHPPPAPESHTVPVANQPANAGTPDPDAGFLGFGPKN